MYAQYYKHIFNAAVCHSAHGALLSTQSGLCFFNALDGNIFFSVPLKNPNKQSKEIL
jgi:hypothetical protein